jgi:hypothetical protein
MGGLYGRRTGEVILSDGTITTGFGTVDPAGWTVYRRRRGGGVDLSAAR